MLKHFLLGAIRRVFRPGSKYEEMLCLVGGQGAGKSSFFRLLAIRDEWFSDDLKKLDDDRVYLKLQGHWIIEMSEMLATSSAKSIEEIRSFISRQKETYRTPYESQPKDRLRQCVFGGSSNTLDSSPCCISPLIIGALSGKLMRWMRSCMPCVQLLLYVIIF